MPISGLLITLDANPAQQSSALAALTDHPNIEIGETSGSRMAVVVETPDSAADKTVWQWLHDLPGVAFVDVVYVHFDEEDPGEASSSQRQSLGAHDRSSVANPARGAS